MPSTALRIEHQAIDNAGCLGNVGGIGVEDLGGSTAEVPRHGGDGRAPLFAGRAARHRRLRAPAADCHHLPGRSQQHQIVAVDQFVGARSLGGVDLALAQPRIEHVSLEV